MSNLIYGKSPYVHSKVQNFQRFTAPALADELAQEQGVRNQLDDVITRLEKLKALIKDATDDFLGPLSMSDLKKVFDSEDPYVKASQLAIQSTAMQEAIAGKISYIQMSAFEGMDITKFFDPLVAHAQYVTAEEVVDAVAKGLEGNFFVGVDGIKGKQRDFIQAKFGDIAEDILKQSKGYYKEKHGNILKHIRNAFSERLNKEADLSFLFESVWAFFVTEFEKNLAQLKAPSRSDMTKEDFLRKLKPRFQAHFKDAAGNAINPSHGQISHASAVIQENLLGDIILVGGYSAEIGINFETTGKDTATEVFKKMGGEGIFEDPFRDQGKYSYTDFIITNGNNGKKARVQGKNYLGALERSKYTDVVGKHRIFETSRLFEFLDAAQSIPGVNLSYRDIEEMAYLIANELFFNQAGTLAGVVREGTDESHDWVVRSSKVRFKADPADVGTKNLEFAEEAIAVIVLKLATYVMGLRFQEVDAEIDDIVLSVEASNLFYLFGANSLVSTYEIIEGLIRNAQKAKDAIFSLHFRPKLNKDVPMLNPRSFLVEKMESTQEKLFPNGNYTDAGLLGVGRKQGALIVENISMTNINLDVLFNEILGAF